MRPEEAMDFLIGVGMFNITNINAQLVDEESVEVRIKAKALKLGISDAVKALSEYREATFGKGETHDPTTTPEV